KNKELHFGGQRAPEMFVVGKAVRDALNMFSSVHGTVLTDDKQKAKTAEMSPEQHLLFGALRGFSDVVQTAVESRNVHPDAVRCEGGKTPLLSAVAKDRYHLFDYLLNVGADPDLEDNHFRNAFYYACFGNEIKLGDHQKFVSRLLSHDEEIGRELSAERVLVASYASNSENVTAIVFDKIDFEIMSRDSNGHCKIRFRGLEKLDDPTVRMKWPDGSFSALGTTAIHVLTKKRKGDLLVHPACLGLMWWKWEKFGLSAFRREAIVMGCQIVSLSMVCILSTKKLVRGENGDKTINDYDSAVPLSIMRLCFECVSVALAFGILYINSYEANLGAKFLTKVLSSHKRVSQFKAPLWSLAPSVLGQASVLTLLILRLCRGPERAQVVLLAVGSLLQWERFVYYMSLRERSGPFFIMLVEMLTRDFKPFATVAAAIVIAFGTSISVLASNHIQDEAMDASLSFTNFLGSAVELAFGFVGTDTFAQVRPYWSRENETDEIIIVFFLAFTVLAPVLAMSLLTALFTSTFNEINENSVAEWALRRFQFLTSREAFVEAPHFGFRLADDVVCGVDGCKIVQPAPSGTSSATGSAKIAPASQVQDERSIFTPCTDSCASGFTIEAAFDSLFGPYEAKNKAAEGKELKDLVLQMAAPLVRAQVSNQGGAAQHLVDLLASSDADSPAYAFRVLGLAPGSPAEATGLVPWFDFVIQVGETALLRKDVQNWSDDSLHRTVMLSVGQPLRLKVFNCKNRSVREVWIVPSRKWAGGSKDVTGLRLMFDSFVNTMRNVVRVIGVKTDSPALAAGLQENSDYILGTVHGQAFPSAVALGQVVAQHAEKNLRLLVYSAIADTVRVVEVVPTRNWPGEGLLGCDIGIGLSHSIFVDARESTGKFRRTVVKVVPPPVLSGGAGGGQSRHARSDSEIYDIVDTESRLSHRGRGARTVPHEIKSSQGYGQILGRAVDGAVVAELDWKLANGAVVLAERQRPSQTPRATQGCGSGGEPGTSGLCGREDASARRMSAPKRAKLDDHAEDDDAGMTMKSFVPVPDDSEFPLQNIPYGVFRPKSGGGPRVGTRVGDHVVDLGELHRAGVFSGFDSSCFEQARLNDFMGSGRAAWTAARTTLQQVLSEGDATVRDNESLRRKVVVPIDEVVMEMPAQIGDYTDFYASRQHATNVGTMFRDPKNALMPNWLHLPVGYHGRSSTVVKSGTPVRRPCGQLQRDAADPKKGATYGPCRLLDFELEMGVFVGPGNKMGEPIDLRQADDHVFGFVLLNDWSARDIQKWEYVPLGPFGAKNFATTISPWVVTADALEPFRCPTSAGEQTDPVPLPYLRETNYSSYNIDLEVSLRAADIGEDPFVLTKSNYKHMYWTHRQMLVHHTVTGCKMNPGDLLGSGTISGDTPDSYGSMLELCWKGTKPIQISPNVERKFLKDGDSVNIRGFCQGDGFRIGFGDCEGTILPATPFQE
ncbi:Fumarylacetoacetase (FAA) (Beta-diketonase) (Fumarylacetoacetate hydrolase), partial [Durusdinium trenchii]